MISAFWGCDNKLAPMNQYQVTPPDLSKRSVFESFSPDSGGIGTQLIIRGKNFGSDPEYVTVTVNNKIAPIVRMDDEMIYAIVPARADTGYVRLYIGKGDNVEEYASDSKFRYQFKRNVTTMVGQQGMKGRDDGPYAASKLQRTWFLLTDKDGTVFLLMKGVVLTKMVRCVGHVTVKWKLWYNVLPDLFNRPRHWRSAPIRIRYISPTIVLRMRLILEQTLIFFT